MIGARYYDKFTTPRDGSGHGTHVASTAAGRPVFDASYYNLTRGTARGGAPGSRIAVYRVCTNDKFPKCDGSAILKAFDDAIADGVDVLSLSLGPSSIFMPDFSNDPIAIGAFHAVEKGIIVVCAAGNNGPSSSTVVNVAPWILTVAATTIDRDFVADVVLGGNQKGRGINFSNLNKSPIYPLIDGESAKLDSNQQAKKSARNCNPESLDGDKVKGSILLCVNNVGTEQSIDKFEALKNDYGVNGMILVDSITVGQKPPTYGVHPIVSITEDDRVAVISYIKSNSNPVATILPTMVIPNYKPAPVVGYFSSRGPTLGIQNLLKPDIAAPGVMILAAWPTIITDQTLMGREPPMFALLSGTSMACPHVSGLAARVKSQHPTWSPSIIRSAIMTTAIRTNNLESPITTITGSRATPYDIGAGSISTSGPIQPGLVYETGILDYILFLCNIGYDPSKIKLIAPNVPMNFSCPPNKSFDSISNMNYPSIAISNLTINEVKTVTRIVTNVEDDDSTYDVIIEAPTGVDVQVIPEKLHFTKDVHKLQFQVVFKVSAKFREDLFVSIAWSNEKHNVRSPFVVIARSDATYSGNMSVSFIFVFCCQMLIAWSLYLA
ncbi:hypothetical protein DH2020_008168 [Rehmannia glutinosa]|uniref:Uncharacterized protein n=1 Tax=Rehmannia glutinosa TaxID=99300 RepID=A0ABR0U094_REHGL